MIYDMENHVQKKNSMKVSNFSRVDVTEQSAKDAKIRREKAEEEVSIHA